MRALLVITGDGYAKRMPLDSIPKTRRGAKGVVVSSVPVAAAIAVSGTDADVVLATAAGKIQVIGLGDIPTRNRKIRHGRTTKGARVMTLAPGDRIAVVVVHSRGEAPVEPLEPTR